MKVVLLRVVPAGFLGFLPVEILRGRHWSWCFGHVAVSLLFTGLGAYVLRGGLRRYESGNSLLVRS